MNKQTNKQTSAANNQYLIKTSTQACKLQLDRLHVVNHRKPRVINLMIRDNNLKTASG